MLYSAVQYVPNVNKCALYYRINKGKTEFYSKARHFKLRGVV